MTGIDLSIDLILTSVLTSSCHTPGTPLLPATPRDRVTSKRPKNIPVIPADPGSWISEDLTGGHLSGLKSNRRLLHALGPIYRTTCRYSSHTAVQTFINKTVFDGFDVFD